MYDIPMVVEKLYDSMVNIPDPKDWPDYIGGIASWETGSIRSMPVCSWECSFRKPAAQRN